VPGTSALVHEDNLDADHDSNVPLWVCHIDHILGPMTPRGLAWRVLDQELHAVSTEEPSSFAEAK
jgi:hypothetical protein